MKINPTINSNNTFNTKIKHNSVNFKKGLPSSFILEAIVANPKKIEQDLFKKGLKANFLKYSDVALCCKKTVEIMEHYGFAIPDEFNSELLNKSIRGVSDIALNRVSINLKNVEFDNVSILNKVEELQSSSGIFENSGHFLQTYLHEFTHIAHYKNLCKIWGEKEALNIFEQMGKYRPTEIMLGFSYAMLQKLFAKSENLKYIGSLIVPPKNGLYAKSDITEYIAEKNTRLIAMDLGDNLTLKNKNQPPILNPQNYYSNLEKVLSNMKTISSVQDLLNLTSKYDRAIWNGELDKLEDLKLGNSTK